jgi:hypothetical protein
MDFKTDILVKIPTFLAEIESKPHNGTIHYQPEEHLGAKQSSSRGVASAITEEHFTTTSDPHDATLSLPQRQAAPTRTQLAERTLCCTVDFVTSPVSQKA